eukprot:TRINITY_DN2383_c0_g1_i1.p1 TRINITY_DN2383_c0_g1~~TRINITY_DN2383_c0_g1_i1.p1  ORF type:complete len:807 (-),score=171.11 TRINITY_DN2383_c0_g1_i1:67-2160(-)
MADKLRRLIDADDEERIEIEQSHKLSKTMVDEDSPSDKSQKPSRKRERDYDTSKRERDSPEARSHSGERRARDKRERSRYDRRHEEEGEGKRREEEGDRRKEENHDKRREEDNGLRRRVPIKREGNRLRKFDNREKDKCPDYFERGWCERGDSCPFEHGQDRMIMDLQELEQQVLQQQDVSTSFRGNRGRHRINRGRGRSTFNANPGFPKRLPENLPYTGPARFPFPGEILPGIVPTAMNGYPSAVIPMGNEMEEDNVSVDLLYRQSIKDTENTTEKKTEEENNNEDVVSPGKEVKKKKDFRASHLKAKDVNATSLTVVSIPHTCNTVGKLHEHFSKFGHIVNVEVIQSHKKAVVKFSSHNDALKAIKSPEAVLGNRFIKVYWTTDDEITEHKHEEKQKSQEEINKFFEEKKKAKVEAVKAVKKQQDELTTKKLEQIKEKQKMLNQLIELSKKAHVTPQTKSSILEKIAALSSSIKTDLATVSKSAAKAPKVPPKPKQVVTPKPVPKEPETEGDAEAKKEVEHISALQSKLETLQEKAKQLGITETGRRRGRGGRWTPSGRATRGRGGRSWGRSGLTLDNRTATFRLIAPHEGNLNEDVLKEHFSQFGRVLEVKIEGPDALVKMDTRHSAELAVKKGAVINEHQTNISWYNETPDGAEANGAEEGAPEEEAEPVVEEFYRKDGGASDSDNDDDSWRR